MTCGFQRAFCPGRVVDIPPLLVQSLVERFPILVDDGLHVRVDIHTRLSQHCVGLQEVLALLGPCGSEEPAPVRDTHALVVERVEVHRDGHRIRDPKGGPASSRLSKGVGQGVRGPARFRVGVDLGSCLPLVRYVRHVPQSVVRTVVAHHRRDHTSLGKGPPLRGLEVLPLARIGDRAFGLEPAYLQLELAAIGIELHARTPRAACAPLIFGQRDLGFPMRLGPDAALAGENVHAHIRMVLIPVIRLVEDRDHTGFHEDARPRHALMRTGHGASALALEAPLVDALKRTGGIHLEDASALLPAPHGSRAGQRCPVLYAARDAIGVTPLAGISRRRGATHTGRCRPQIPVPWPTGRLGPARRIVRDTLPSLHLRRDALDFALARPSIGRLDERGLTAGNLVTGWVWLAISEHDQHGSAGRVLRCLHPRLGRHLATRRHSSPDGGKDHHAPETEAAAGTWHRIPGSGAGAHVAKQAPGPPSWPGAGGRRAGIRFRGLLDSPQSSRPLNARKGPP